MIKKVKKNGLCWHRFPSRELTKHYEKIGIKITIKCQKQNGVILTQFKNPDGNVIWLSEKTL